MRPADLSHHVSQWFDGSGPGAEIVISSRIRLARNLAGYEFLPCLSKKRQAEVLEKLKETILSLDLGERYSSSTSVNRLRWNRTCWSKGTLSVAGTRWVKVREALLSRPANRSPP